MRTYKIEIYTSDLEKYEYTIPHSETKESACRCALSLYLMFGDKNKIKKVTAIEV